MNIWYDKNNMNKITGQKMFKPLALTSIILAGGLALTGCTATSTTANNAGSSDGKTYGTYKDFTDNVSVTDSFGTYMSTKLNPDSKALTYDPSRTQPQFYNLGYTDTDGAELQKFIANFVATEGTDSIALDSKDGSQKWVDTVFNTYMGGDYAGDMKADILKEDSNFFVKGLPLTVRDSKPRVTSSSIHINQVDAYTNSSGKFVTVSGDATTKYRATEKNVLANTIEANKANNLDEATILAVYPSLKDGKEEVIDSQFTFYYILQKLDGKWKIVGYNNNRVYQVESMRNNATPTAGATPGATPAPTASK